MSLDGGGGGLHCEKIVTTCLSLILFFLHILANKNTSFKLWDKLLSKTVFSSTICQCCFNLIISPFFSCFSPTETLPNPTVTPVECKPLAVAVQNIFSDCKNKIAKAADRYLHACAYDVVYGANNAAQRLDVACDSFDAFAADCKNTFNMDLKRWREALGCRMYWLIFIFMLVNFSDNIDLES